MRHPYSRRGSGQRTALASVPSGLRALPVIALLALPDAALAGRPPRTGRPQGAGRPPRVEASAAVPAAPEPPATGGAGGGARPGGGGTDFGANAAAPLAPLEARGASSLAAVGGNDGDGHAFRVSKADDSKQLLANFEKDEAQSTETDSDDYEPAVHLEVKVLQEPSKYAKQMQKVKAAGLGIGEKLHDFQKQRVDERTSEMLLRDAVSADIGAMDRSFQAVRAQVEQMTWEDVNFSASHAFTCNARGRILVLSCTARNSGNEWRDCNNLDRAVDSPGSWFLLNVYGTHGCPCEVGQDCQPDFLCDNKQCLFVLDEEADRTSLLTLPNALRLYQGLHDASRKLQGKRRAAAYKGKRIVEALRQLVSGRVAYAYDDAIRVLRGHDWFQQKEAAVRAVRRVQQELRFVDEAGMNPYGRIPHFLQV